MKLPEHKCGLYLEHNSFKDMYETAEKWCNEEFNDQYEWESENHMLRAIETNEIWTLQWYPNTPIGCHMIAAPTLEELLSFAETIK